MPLASDLAAEPEMLLTFEERPDTAGRTFDVRLAVRDARWIAALRHATWGEIVFASDPVEFFKRHFAAIGEAPGRAAEAEQARFAERFAAAGALFARQVLPEGIRRCLAALQGDVRGLHVVSAAPWIPWEFLRIESRPDSAAIDGAYLAEAFALTRGIPGLHLPRALPLADLAAVIAAGQGLANLEGEWQDLERLAAPGERTVARIPARLQPVLAALRSGAYDGWHIATHGHFDSQAADLSDLALDGGEELSATHLEGIGEGFGARRPLVFLNTCAAARGGMSLSSLGGWAPRLLQAGAGAFVGPIWPVDDARARAFAHTFYREILGGKTLGEAALAARRAILSPADPSGLAYAVYAHPAAVCAPPASPVSTVRSAAGGGEEEPLQCDLPPWDSTKPPGTLLRAEYGIVRFHGREQELADLDRWCVSGARLAVRLYTGQGGMGKTRLAFEIARQRQAAGWQAGFLSPSPAMAPREIWNVLRRRGGRMLLIVDYAETRRKLLVPLLQQLVNAQEGPIRVVLIARAALEWWDQLKQEGSGVGDLLSGSATSRHPLGALALTVAQRRHSFGHALEDFSHRLDQTPPAATLADPDAAYFERALLLHMSALAAISGVEVKGEEGILDFVLGREKLHWQNRAAAAGLDPLLVRGIGRAMAAITLAGGVLGLSQAVTVMSGLTFFADQPYAVLEAIASLLRDAYPDPKRGIEPILPDLLGEHLVQREMEAGADELLDLVLGPRDPTPSPSA